MSIISPLSEKDCTFHYSFHNLVDSWSFRITNELLDITFIRIICLERWHKRSPTFNNLQIQVNCINLPLCLPTVSLFFFLRWSSLNL